jgi:uncharacterized protein YbaR (Trm112 family)
MLSKELLDILCCPKCHGDLRYEPDKNTLTCVKCGKIYQVKDNIPIMLIDDEQHGTSRPS